MGSINQSHEFIIAVLAGTLIFLLFSIFFIVYIVFFLKRRDKHRQEVERLKTEFKEEILKSQLEIKEHTFNDISQEIHDNVGQLLSLAKVQVNIMHEVQQLDNMLLDDLRQNIGQAMTDLRNIARSLSTESITSMSIEEAISLETQRINRCGLLQISVCREGQDKKINDQNKLILFRIIQESLQNIIKHARAEEADILFQYLPTEIRVVVRDNGQGFDPDLAMPARRGLGLGNIKNRAALTGGACSIMSRRNEGTTITLNIPYE